ncbi:MAG: hypothetical protein ABI051_16580 [Vicinamibacterales bacterium]
MKKSLSAMCLVTAFGVGTGVYAQSTPMAQASMDKATAAKAGEMTMSGCVMAGADANRFMLTNAMKAGGMMEKDQMNQPGMAGQSGQAGMTGDHMMSYELVGGTNLKAHMGHKVEVTGTMSKMDMDRMTSMDKMDKMAKDKMMSDKTMQAMKLNVTNVKMVAATCP